MMKVAVFVDGANYFYMQKKLGWKIDARRLLAYCDRLGQVADAYYYIGKDEAQQSYFAALTNIGYTLRTKPIKSIREADGDIKLKANMDVEIVLDLVTTLDRYDLAVLVSGDGDFCRALEYIQSQGKAFLVLSTAGLVAQELRVLCGEGYIDFQTIRDQVERLV